MQNQILYQVRWIKHPYTGKDCPNDHCWQRNLSDINEAFRSKEDAEKSYVKGECVVEEMKKQ